MIICAFMSLPMRSNLYLAMCRPREDRSVIQRSNINFITVIGGTLATDGFYAEVAINCSPPNSRLDCSMLFRNFKERRLRSISYSDIDGVFPSGCRDKYPTITSIIVFQVLFTILMFRSLHTYILCSAANAVSSGSWFIVFNV